MVTWYVTCQGRDNQHPPSVGLKNYSFSLKRLVSYATACKLLNNDRLYHFYFLVFITDFFFFFPLWDIANFVAGQKLLGLAFYLDKAGSLKISGGVKARSSRHPFDMHIRCDSYLAKLPSDNRGREHDVWNRIRATNHDV